VSNPIKINRAENSASQRPSDHEWVSMTKQPRDLYDDFIKLEWQNIFRTEVHVKLDSGYRYVPNSGSQGVQLLRPGVNAWDEAIRQWSVDLDPKNTSSAGYDRIVDQAGIEYTWEWFLIDDTRPWAKDVPADVRQRIEEDLSRRVDGSVARVKARAEEAERIAAVEDGRVIQNMNARRTEQGKPPLTAEQESSVRESRRKSRGA
jgi:hypothetical protein